MQRSRWVPLWEERSPMLYPKWMRCKIWIGILQSITARVPMLSSPVITIQITNNVITNNLPSVRSSLQLSGPYDHKHKELQYEIMVLFLQIFEQFYINPQLFKYLQQILSMSIIDLISLGSNIIGITEDGYLINWNTSSQNVNKEDLKILPYLQSDFSYKATEHTPFSLLQNSQSIYICTDKQIKQIKILDLMTFIKKSKHKEFKYELPSKIFREQQGISNAILFDGGRCSIDHMVDERKQNQNNSNQLVKQDDQSVDLVFSTKTGKILSVGKSFSKSSVLYELDAHQTGHNLGWHEYATSLVPYRENSLMLVGTSTGRILILNLVNRKIIEDITARNNLKLLSVHQITMGIRAHKFYSRHENCLIQWSMELQKCLGYYAYNSPYSVLLTQKMCIDSQKILISGGGKFIEVIDANNPKILSQYQTSLQSVHTMKEISGKIYCGGSYGMIEVIQLGITNVILFKSEQITVF